MKPIDQKDRPKVIMLAALMGLLVLYVVFQLGILPSGQAAATAPSPSPSSSPLPGGESKVAEAEAPVFDPRATPLVASGRDPFVPNGAAAMLENAPPAPPPAAKPAPSVPYMPGVPQNGQIGKSLKDILGMKPEGLPSGRNPLESNTPAPVAAVVLPPPPPPAYTVTGIVLADGKGGRDVAILRGGSEERRFVTVGEELGRGFLVAKIHAAGIDLKDKNSVTHRIVTLPLGKTE